MPCSSPKDAPMKTNDGIVDLARLSAVRSRVAPKASLVCPACGPARFRGGAKYCDECGHKLSNGATSHVRSRSPHREVITDGHRNMKDND